jgi:uncharacterized C2H2 Zn-finger protein
MSARKPTNCPICGRLIKQKKNLPNHIKNKHNAEKNRLKKERLTCDVCGSVFTRKYNLDRHIQALHPEKAGTSNVIIRKKTDDSPQWSQTTIEIDMIDAFIQDELIEFFKKSNKSEYELETNMLSQKSIKFIDTWTALKLQIDQAFDMAEDWEDFFEHFKSVIIHIKADLYLELHQQLNNHQYKNLIPIFNRLKIWLSANGGIWNHQSTKNIVNKMSSF